MSRETRGLSEKKLVLITAGLIIAVVTLSIATLFLAPGIGRIGLEGAGYIALIRIEGPLEFRGQGYSILGASRGVEDYIRLIEQALKDSSAKSVILYINSPGGSATASEALYFAVEKLAREKPVVAYIAGYGTSGAYMAALPADKIIASNSSITGAVGVYTLVISFKGLLEKLGLEVYTFKSGRLKDIGSPFRKLTPEEAEVFEEIILDLFEIFKARVLKHRSVSDEVFSGRPYTARRALELGLIDDIGTLDKAKQIARELAGLPSDAPVRELKPPKPGLFELLGWAGSQRIKPLPSQEILAMWPPPTLLSP